MERSLVINKVFETENISATLITSTYRVPYRENDYNEPLTVSFPIKGCFNYAAGKEQLFLANNSVLVERPHLEFSVTKFKECSEDMTLCIHQKAGGILHDQLAMSGKAVTYMQRTVQMEYSVSAFLKLLRSKNKLQQEHRLINILNQVNSCFDTPSPNKIYNRYNIAKVQDVIAYMQDQLTNEITISRMAAIAHLDVFYFSKIFKHITGYSPYDYLLQLRLEHARQLLSQGMAVNEAAMHCGFSSPQHFSYSFRKNTGSPPLSFKKDKISKASSLP